MDEITMNNEVIDQVAEQAVEAVVSKNNVNWGKVGAGILGIGAAVAGTALVIKGVKYVIAKVNEKKAQQEAAEATVIDNVKVAENDFVD